MMKKRIFTVLRRILLLLIIVTLFIGISKVFERKTLTGAWNCTLKVNGFKNEAEDSMDIIGFGSSHMYCTFNPVHVYKETGLNIQKFTNAYLVKQIICKR